MRTRKSSTQKIYPSSEMVQEQWYPWYLRNYDVASQLSDHNKVMTDQVNPGYFKALRAGGVLPVGPMTKTDIDTQIVSGESHFKAYMGSTLWQSYDFKGLHGTFGKPSAPARPSVNKSALLQKALASAQTNAFDTLTFAAEFHKTVEMFTTAAQRYRRHAELVFAQAQRNAASSKFGKHDRGVDFLVEAWFEYRFGLRPILYDIEGALEVWRRLQEGRPVLSRGWASDSASANRSYASKVDGFRYSTFFGTTTRNPKVFSLGGGGMWTEQAGLTTTVVEGHASVGVDVTTRGLTMSDPVLTLWELTPMSVFADYFISIGTMLAAFSPFATGNFAYATYSETITTTTTHTARWVVNGSSGSTRVVGTSSPSTIVQTETVYNRSLEKVSPNLSVELNLSMAQVTDLVALGWTLRRRLTAITRLLARR
nr:MAG: hypothetical protein [Eriocheir sinensis solspivirus 1]